MWRLPAAVVALLCLAWLGGCAAAPAYQREGVFPPAGALGTPAAALTTRPAADGFEESYALLEAGNYAAAEQGFRAWLDSPGSADASRASKALFWVGYCQEKLGRPEDASQTFLEVLRRFPNTPAADLARKHADRLGPR